MTEDTAREQSGDSPVSGRLEEIANRIGRSVAGPHAYEVDRNARFPTEAIAALKREGVLGALIPVEQGGMGASLSDLSHTIQIISRYCASTGCILAMHTSDLSILLQYGTTPPLRRLIQRVADEGLLIANAVSEVKRGGDISGSLAALEPDGDGWRFSKQVLACSYGLHADLITSSIRRSPDVAESDQVLAIFSATDVSLAATSEWDTLGMRGTDTRGLQIEGHVTDDAIYPTPFPDISVAGGQVIHVLLPAVWVGLAEAALEDAHVKVRADARKQIGAVSSSALRLAEMLADVQAARSTLADALRSVEAGSFSGTLLLASLRNVKLITTMTALNTATAALQICGMGGFRRGEKHRLERVIRDACGGLVMISNDRLLNDNAASLRIQKSI